MKIYIQGWASFEEWRAASYPGAPSFAHPKTKIAERPQYRPDPRRGLCTWPGCDNVAGGGGSSARLNLCGKHNKPIVQRPYVPLAER